MRDNTGAELSDMPSVRGARRERSDSLRQFYGAVGTIALDDRENDLDDPLNN
jgi:hypothetical protein